MTKAVWGAKGLFELYIAVHYWGKTGQESLGSWRLKPVQRS